MALKKAFKTKFGIEAEYWSIGDFIFDFNSRRCEFVLNLHLSEKAKKQDTAEKFPEALHFDMGGEKFIFEKSMSIDACYQFMYCEAKNYNANLLDMTTAEDLL